MELVKEKIANNIRGLVERFGYMINPILLKIIGEDSQVLVFYFHALYRSLEHKKLDHIDPQKNMTVNQFDDFIDYFLSNGYNFIRPTDLLKGLPTEKRYAIVTFDDGYFNNTLSLEVLEKYRIPAVFFITANNIRDNKSFWWDVVYKYRTKQGANKIKIRDEQEQIKQFKYDYIDSYIAQNFGKDSLKPWSDIDRPMTEMEVREFSKSEYAVIGNHTLNHAILTNYNKNEIREEFIGSNKYLNDLIGYVPTVMAFPNGDFNDSALEVAEEVGFKVVFNAIPKKNKLPVRDGNLILLNRFMSNDNNIRYYGSFYRLGYTPGSLRSSITNRFQK